MHCWNSLLTFGHAIRYVRAEGMAGIVLKRSDLAFVPRWANLPPYATFLNAGTNNDGFTKEGLSESPRLLYSRYRCFLPP